MGYRTDGLWVISGPVNDIIAAWTACRLQITLPQGSEWDEFSVYRVKDTGYIRYEFDSYKWYRGFPEVDFCESVWSALSVFAEDQETNTISGKRLHVDEDNATETDEFGDDPPDIYTSCTIEDSEPSSGDPINLPTTTPATATT